MKIHYDLHVHSCLSPCGDDDMTPANIAGMAKLLGLDAVALTDHNSCANCPAFFKACSCYGVVPIAGAEVTTAEDIHLVTLFSSLEAALEFGEALKKRLLPIKNKPHIFGEQLIVDENDAVLSKEETLLITATDMGIEEAHDFAVGFGGVCYPAHIDRVSNGMTAVLGDFPERPVFALYELNDGASYELCRSKYPAVRALQRVVSSDAHRLEDMREAEAFFSIDAGAETPDEIRQALFSCLKGERL